MRSEEVRKPTQKWHMETCPLHAIFSSTLAWRSQDGVMIFRVGVAGPSSSIAVIIFTQKVSRRVLDGELLRRDLNDHVGELGSSLEVDERR